MGSNLIWVDLEMTGLDVEKRVILEIATIVTNQELEPVAEGPNIAINYPEAVLQNMSEWSIQHHEASGLLERARTSSHGCGDAEKATLDFLSLQCKKGESPLCGNSVWQDRLFLM